jgi:demethoxyubiquinone hydroxylase (CLK1/Coq7/Cat5 family)
MELIFSILRYSFIVLLSFTFLSFVALLTLKIALMVIDAFYKIIDKHFDMHLTSEGYRSYELKSIPKTKRWYPTKD